MRKRFLNTHKRVCIAYTTGIIQFFSIILILIISVSCSSRQERIIEKQNSVCISDDAFINDLNSFDSTAVVHDLFVADKKMNGSIVYCVIIEQSDSLFFYRGTGTYLQRYYKERVIGDYAKQ